MSYPQGAPGGPGYPQAPHFAAQTQQFAKLPGSEAAGRSRLPAYLASAIAALGILVYLASFGPQFTAGSESFFISPLRIDLAVAASVLAALIAGVSLLPKQTARPALVAVLTLLSFLFVISTMLTAPTAVTIGWGMYLVVGFTAIQTIVGVGALLVDAGVITPPAPRPRYEQQYGQYPGNYYGQPPGQPQHGAPMHQQQRPGYQSPYGGGYPSTDPSTGGFSAASPSGQAGHSGPGGQAGQPGHAGHMGQGVEAEQSGPPTPPTGFPAYGRPPSSNAGSATATQASRQHESESSSQSDQSS